MSSPLGSGIHVMAVITTLMAASLYGWLIWALSDCRDRLWLLMAAVCTLPLQPLVFYLVRSPLNSWLLTVLDANSGLYQFVALWYAPLTEEPAKLLPLLIPALRRRVNPHTYILFGLSLGLGFGIGEIWFLADHIAKAPAFAVLPFYQFTGFAQERFIICFVHGALTTIVLKPVGNCFVSGLLAAMGLHGLLNAPILLAVHDIGGIGKPTWLMLLVIWVLVYYLGMICLLGWWRWGRSFIRTAFYAQCPECRQVYRRPFLSLNAGFKSYERCPYCRNFHWVDMRTLLTEPNEEPKDDRAD